MHLFLICSARHYESGIDGRVQDPTLRAVFIFDKDGIRPGIANTIPGPY